MVIMPILTVGIPVQIIRVPIVSHANMPFLAPNDVTVYLSINMNSGTLFFRLHQDVVALLMDSRSYLINRRN